MTFSEVGLTIGVSAVTTLLMTLLPYAGTFRRLPKPTAEELTRAIESVDWVAVATGGRQRPPVAGSGSGHCDRWDEHRPHQWGMQRNPVYMYCNGERRED